MGHIGVKRLSAAADGVPFIDDTPYSCDICAQANIKRFPFPSSSSTRATRVLERIHSDICGPLPIGYGSVSYFITFIDCYSRYSTVYALHSKDEAITFFKQFSAAVENIHSQKITYLRCDNAGEYVGGQFAEHAKAVGITYEKIVPGASPQNGVAERHNYTFSSMARAMLIDAEFSDWFWPFAIQTAVHIKNRVPHKALPKDVTPFQLWFGSRPDLSHIRPFGAHCTSRIVKSVDLKKFEHRGERGRFIGYARNAKGYLFWDPSSKRVLTRRDLVFHGPSGPSIGQGGVEIDYSPLAPLWLESGSNEVTPNRCVFVRGIRAVR